MRQPLPVEISQRAAREIRELETWWRRNRTAAPAAVREELERVLRIVTVTPFIGKTATDVELAGVRRVHVSRIWHFLYYRVHTTPARIEILSLWSESRGEGPSL
jgi:plasmid stabilization system protein ParE